MLWQIENQALFGRLYLHAVMHLQELSVDEAIGACLDRADVLWRYEYEPEFLALLRVRGPQISQHLLNALVERLLAESPREEDRSPDIDDKRRKRLAKLLRAGVSLEGRARALADEYLAQHPPTEDPREDEVRYRVVEARWIGPPSTKELIGKGIDEVIRLVDQGRDEFGSPHDEWSKAKQVADWLRHETSRIADALAALAGRDDRPAGFVDGVFWALRDVTTQPEVLAQIDRATAALKASPFMIDAAFDACSAWIKALATSDVSDDTFWPVWDLVRARAPADDAALDDMSLTAAINSAGGYLTEAVIDRFWKTGPTAGQGLSTDVRERLTPLVSGTSRVAVHARLVCMPPLHALHAVDPDWTNHNLLGYLRWANQENDLEVSSLWSTQLDYGRWSLDLMASLKGDFLVTLEMRNTLDEAAYRSACWRFAALGIEHPGFLSSAEIRDGFHNMGPEGAVFVLDLFEARLGQSEQPESEWREMIAPWLMTHWPPQERFRTEAIRTAAAQMLLETGEAFSEALQTLQSLHLVGVINRDRLVLFDLARGENANGEERTGKFPYATSFPIEVCRWLDQILPADLPGHEQHDLNTVIEAIQRGVEGPAVPQCLLHLRERTL